MDRVRSEWREARADGVELLVMAQSRTTVAAVSNAIRSERVRSGELEAGVLVATGSGPIGLASGDVVMTGRNGDRWIVKSVGRVAPDLARNLTVVRVGYPSAVVELPAGYLHGAGSLEYGYAMTAHKAQGQTVDRAVLVVDDRTNREALYVGLTRGRHSNMTIAVTVSERPESHGLDHSPTQTGVEVVQAAAQREGTEATGAELLAAQNGHINLSTVEADEVWKTDTAAIGGDTRDPLHPATPPVEVDPVWRTLTLRA